MLDDEGHFTVTDLKQFAYCGRVIFYERCLPHIRPRTYKMDAGRDSHEEEQKRAVRRTLTKYELSEGQRQFEVRLISETLGLHGILDELVVSTQGEHLPVDYKLAKQVSPNHRVQLTAYALLVEETYHISVQRGYIYLIPSRKTVEIPVTSQLRDQVSMILGSLKQMVAQERMPSSTTNRNRCMACEFRRFCNDV